MRDNINASWPHHAKYNQLVTPKTFRISVNVSSSSIRFPRSKITNPIIPGQSIEDKEFRLDINVLLNNHTIINPEMQVANEPNWPNRSILYLCRSFDNPKHGQDYQETMPAIHIGFLDYTLFKGKR